MTFVEKLRQLRDNSGMSESQLAAASGVPFGTLHKYALGLRRPPFDAVAKIARALGTTCEAFADCSDVIGTIAPPAEEPSPNKSRKRK